MFDTTLINSPFHYNVHKIIVIITLGILMINTMHF